MKKKVLLGMSGGVDSSVAAYLLLHEGYEVIGATMNLWKDDTQVHEDNSIEDAKKVADRLGINHIVIDFKDEFKKNIVEYFIEEYFAGKTPNPCVLCNKKIKFGILYDKAIELGCDYIATGHYAVVAEENGIFRIKKSDYDKKDQTYVLYNLNQEKLKRTLFPIGNYSKEKIREIAKTIGLEVHNKPESQDICFIPDNDYIRFIKNNSSRKIVEGDFVDQSGKILGKHKGLINYTIGQRKGLGIAFGKPMYVVDINAKNNRVIIGENEDLMSNIVYAKDVNFIEKELEEVSYPISVEAKIRYSAKPAKAVITKEGNNWKLAFEKAQRAITRGQSVVFYDGTYLLGGGIII